MGKTSKIKKDVKDIVNIITYEQKVKNFIKKVRQETKDEGVKCTLKKSKHVKLDDENFCGGYFDEETLVVATGKPMKDWFPVLVHEYCHFLQWKDDAVVWKLSEGTEEIYWNWIIGKIELTPKLAHASMVPIREMEKDCEQRVLKLIDEYDLPICKKYYAKRANSYLTFYNATVKKRKWYKKGKAPYSVPKVFDSMPTKIFKDFDRVPKKLVDTIIENCM